jgi:hypothetical protein
LRPESELAGLEGKTPRQIEKIKILDPACGSGSFLLGAYQCLIDHHENYYRAHPKQAKFLYYDPYYKLRPDDISLPIQEKARILKNNIFGVDIDPQAVEITMLSLYLKAIEGERGSLPMRQHLLPPLSNNIICGNSLVGYDMFEGKLFPDETKNAVNPFDWNSKLAGFGEITDSGGFDVVIGNPPYVRQELLGSSKEYFKTHYKVYHGTADLYAYFIEKAISLLKQGGYFSYIVANKWMRANYGGPLRQWLKEQPIEEIVDFGDLRVFESATTYPCILSIHKGPSVKSFRVTQVKALDFDSLAGYVQDNAYAVAKSSLGEQAWSLSDEKSQTIMNKVMKVGVPLREFVKGKIFYGIKTGLNEAFVIDRETKERLIADDSKSVELIKPFLLGRDIKRYQPPTSDRYVIFTRRGVDIKQYPAIQKHLALFKDRLMPKPKNWAGETWKGRKSGSYKWYEVQDAVDYYEEFEKPKIIIPAIVKEASYTFDTNGFYSNDKTSIVGSKDLYLIAVLNSSISDFVIHSIASTKQGGYFEYKPMYVERLPIRPIDFNNPSEKATHDKIVSFVERMLALHKRKNDLPPSSERDKLEREITMCDETIDTLVYDLYQLTIEERKIIEAGKGKQLQ